MGYIDRTFGLRGGVVLATGPSQVSLTAVAILIAISGCSQSDPHGPAPAAATGIPSEFQAGEAAFNQFCSPCHGSGAAGTDRGPTFLSKIYEPNHHGDAAFLLAVQNGVRAHHWQFGDMPPIQGLTPDQVRDITGYVRWLQRGVGIQ